MKLLSIRLKNFRQFYNEQFIEFAQGDQNVTIIFGENGKGKTGIFRALIFGLFGEIYLAQDNEKDKIHLVNFIKLEENQGMPITANVKIEFEHNEERYIIERSIQGFKIESKIEERILQPKLEKIDKNGNLTMDEIEDEEEIKEIINRIIDEKIKDFFLFDAEKIETLAKTNAHIKEEVKSVIIKLLQIDKLDKSINILKNLYNKENKELVKKSSNIDLKNKEIAIKNKKEEIKNIEEKIQLKNENYSSCLKEIEESEMKLAENEEIRKIQKDHEQIKDKKNDKVQTLKYIKQSLKNEHFNQGHMLFMKDLYPVTKEYLNQVIIEQKDLISIEIIEKSLKEMVCSCCKTDLNDIKGAYENILKMKENYKRSQLTPLITEINSNIYEFSKNKDEIADKIKDKLKEIRFIKDEINFLDKKLDQNRSDIQEFSNSEINLKSIEGNLEMRKVQADKIKIEVEKLKFEIDNKLQELNKLNREYSELRSQDSALEYDNKKIAYIEQLKDSLEKIFIEYSDDMRVKLMEETTFIFRQLIDVKDKNLIAKIQINEKYEIEPYNWLGTKITQDLSQGQKQVMALAFITALAKVASGGNQNIDFPLFMDTPFGRISGNNRDNLIENIPKLTSQWVLLLTDTEFTVSEEMKIKSINKLGKWYKLDQIKPGYTNIIEGNILDNMATRR